MQYHLSALPGYRPYIGAGVNYTRSSSLKRGAAAPLAELDFQRNSLGPVVQAGIDVQLGKGWSINVDAKYVKHDTRVRLGTTTIGTFRFDPFVLGTGIGRRF